MHPDDRPAVAVALQQVLLNETAQYEVELRLRHRDGAYRSVLSRAAVVRDASGRATRLLGVHIDITERIQTALALRDAHAWLALATESAKIAVWEVDVLRLTIRFSSGWSCVLGRTEGEMPLAALWDLVHPDDRARITATMQEGLHGPRAAYETEGRMLHADGSYRWVLSRGTIHRDAAGRPSRLVGVDMDVTERKGLEAALHQTQVSLRMATENAKVAVWQSDLRTLTIRFSSAWQRLLGYEPGEVTLVALWDLVHPDDRATSARALQEHLQGRAAVYETEQRMRHADGSYRWVLSRGIVSHDPVGRPAHVFGADIDLTEHKALQEALRRSEEQYRHLVEDITDVIYATDREGRITYMSPVAERLFGDAPADVLNRHFSEFIFPEDLPAVADGFREAVAGHPRPHDHRVVTHAGVVRWVRNHARPIEEDDQVVGLRGVISDVTDQREAHEALRERSALLQTANQELEAFSYSVSHDLRAPLRHVQGFCEVLRQDYADRLDEGARHHIERITAGCTRMTQMIDDLLTLSRVGRHELRQESVNLSAVARDIIGALGERDAARHVTTVIAPDLRASGDSGLLRTVLENLLGNAWKYTSKRAHAHIEFGSNPAAGVGHAGGSSPGPHRATRTVAFFIRDDGAGFDPRYTERLFAPFQRLHSVTEFEGTGIGLAIVQRIIRRHGGQVWATAAVDQGATFSFTLPPR